MLEAFGYLAAATMVICYALEERDERFTVAFAASCAAASAYAFATRAWPFFVLEAIWSVVAFRRGLRSLFRSRHPGAPARKETT